MQITTIPMDQAFAHVPSLEMREALTTGTWHPLIATHRGRLRLAAMCYQDFRADLTIPAVGCRSACVITRSYALIDMDRFNHKPTEFLLALRSYWLA